MIYLLHYDRAKGALERLQEFRDDERACAEQERLELELKVLVNQRLTEIVLLEADSIDQLKRTHRRYFESLNTLAGGTTRRAANE